MSSVLEELMEINDAQSLPVDEITITEEKKIDRDLPLAVLPAPSSPQPPSPVNQRCWEANFQPIFHLGRTTFTDIMSTTCFLDKTLLIKQFFYYHTVLVTAPRRFCKSTNLDMLKTFLELQVDEQGNPIKSKNFEIFRELNISQYPLLLKKHLGQHPVILINLNCNMCFRCCYSMLMFLRRVLHRSFRQHSYLLNSEKLTDTEKATFNMYCDIFKFKRLKEEDILFGVKILCEYLFKHFNKKPYILIDEYDSPISKLIYKTNINSGLNEALELFRSAMFSIFDDPFHYIGRAFITGTTTAGLRGISHIQSFTFLNDEFALYYGVTPDEVKMLFEKFNVVQQLAPKLQEWYSGYTTLSGKITLYSLWPLLNFLKTGKIDNYWMEPSYIKNLKGVLLIDEVKSKLELMYKGGRLCVQFKDRINYDILASLRDVSLKRETLHYLQGDVLFQLLLELGYLSYSEVNPIQIVGSGRCALKIPNEEIKKELMEFLIDFTIVKVPIDKLTYVFSKCWHCHHQRY